MQSGSRFRKPVGRLIGGLRLVQQTSHRLPQITRVVDSISRIGNDRPSGALSRHRSDSKHCRGIGLRLRVAVLSHGCLLIAVFKASGLGSQVAKAKQRQVAVIYPKYVTSAFSYSEQPSSRSHVPCESTSTFKVRAFLRKTESS